VANPAFRNEYEPPFPARTSVERTAVVFGLPRETAVRSLAMLVPLATLAAVVLTANHFILDASPGLAIALGMAAAPAFRALVVRYRSRRPRLSRIGMGLLAGRRRPRGQAPTARIIPRAHRYPDHLPEDVLRPFDESIVKRPWTLARSIHPHDIRKWAKDRHKTVDDYPTAAGRGW
jgi:hypothetical protein